MCDANYAQCEDSRRSVGGGLETVGGAILGWSSKKEPIVALSSCESELIQYTHSAQNARFLQQLMEELFGEIIPTIVFEDNAGCIFFCKEPEGREQN